MSTTMSTREFRVSGMTCGHCVQAVTTEVSAVPGISQVAVDLDSGVLTVTGESIDDAAIAAAVNEAGYDLVR